MDISPFTSPLGAALQGATQGYQQGRSLDIQRQQFMAQLQMRQQMAQMMMQGRMNVANINTNGRLSQFTGVDPVTGLPLHDAAGNNIAGTGTTRANQVDNTNTYHQNLLTLNRDKAIGGGLINAPTPNNVAPGDQSFGGYQPTSVTQNMLTPPPTNMPTPMTPAPVSAPPAMAPGAPPMAGAPPMPVPAGSNPYSASAAPNGPLAPQAADPMAGLGPKARADIQAKMTTADKPTMQFLSSIPGAMAAVGRLPQAAQGPAIKALNLEAGRRGISPIMAEPGTQTGTKSVPTLGPMAPVNGVPQFLPDKQVPVMAPYLTPSVTDAARIAQQGAQTQLLGVKTATGQALLPGAVPLQAAKTNFFNTNTAGAALKNTQIVPDAQARRALEGAQGTAATSNAGTNAFRATHPAAGGASGTAGTALYDRAMARMTALTTPGRDAFGSPLPAKATVDAQGNATGPGAAEYNALARQTKGAAGAQGGNAAPNQYLHMTPAQRLSLARQRGLIK